MKFLPIAAAALLASPHVLAAGCEDNFATKGDPRNGSAFSTRATVADVSVASALGQLRGIATADGFKVLNEDAGDKAGTLVIEQSKGVKHPFLITFDVTRKGGGSEVAIRTRLDRGVTAKPEDIRNGMCGMVARLKGGSEGEKLAEKARKAAPANDVIKMKAITLARELDEVARKLKTEVVSARYKGKVYLLDGEINKEPFENEGTIEIWYDVFREGNWLMPPEAGSEISRTQVVCRLAKDQLEEGRMLRPGDMARLTGTVVRFTDGIPRKLVLDKCKFS